MTTFYAVIPPIERITDITDLDHYYDVPADWHIALTDVKGSTKAIEGGRYKDVNAVAAASITSLLNAAGREDIPFLFGGDGATVLIPEAVLPAARDALIGTQRLAKEQFNLELRVGIVPVSDVLREGGRAGSGAAGAGTTWSSGSRCRTRRPRGWCRAGPARASAARIHEPAGPGGAGEIVRGPGRRPAELRGLARLTATAHSDSKSAAKPSSVRPRPIE